MSLSRGCTVASRRWLFRLLLLIGAIPAKERVVPGESHCLATDAPREIGSRVQLLVDDWLIASRPGLERVLQPARKAEGGLPIRVWQRRADGTRQPLLASVYASPLYDAQRRVFRLWSRVFPGLPEGTALEGSAVHRHMRYGYSESVDGVNFDFVQELQGLQSNGDYNSVVTLDAHEPDPAHRYKIGYDGAQPGETNGACLAHSADGIHWIPYNGGKPVTGRAADFTNCLVWDDAARVYRLFTRTDYGTGGGPGEIRGMRMMVNRDVKARPTDWQTVHEWQFDQQGPEEHHRRQIYTMTDWMHHGIHFGLFSVYEWPNDFREGRETDHQKRHERDVLNYYIATSRDAVHWDLQWIQRGMPFVERGGDGAWDKDLILPANWIVTRDDGHWVYYGGANERHGTAGLFQPKRSWGIGLARLPRDRFVSLQAGAEPAELQTRPLVFHGDRLVLNGVTEAGGDIRVEMQDTAGRVLPGHALADCAPLAGDHLAHTVHWKSGADVRRWQGEVVRLRIVVRQAQLFSLQFLPRD
ncbi:MAG: hypothetical protein ACK50P_18655 [Planctomycetaceae bacterium]|jgi:hypothetical protein